MKMAIGCEPSIIYMSFAESLLDRWLSLLSGRAKKGDSRQWQVNHQGSGAIVLYCQLCFIR